MKTLKDRILLHQEPFIRGLCQQELPPEKKQPFWQMH